MKKLALIFVTVILNIVLFSCTADDVLNDGVSDNLEAPQACCDQEGDIPPPPPPPPPKQALK